MLRNLFPYNYYFYDPDGSGGGTGVKDDLSASLDVLNDDADDLDVKDGDDELDLDDDNESDDLSGADDEEEDDKGADEDDKADDEDADDEKEDKEDKDEKDDKKDDKDRKDGKDKEIEARDLSPKALKEYDPKIFKAFPELKDTIFQHREYNKLFGSVEEAAEAADKAQTFDEIAGSTLQGDPTELINALEKTGKDSLERFSTSFMEEIRKASTDLYYKITDPVIAKALKAAESHAGQRNDKNLRLAVQYLSHFIFGDKDVPVFEGGRKKEPDPERLQFEEDRRTAAEEHYREHERTVYDYTERKLETMIKEGLDPDNVYNNFVKEALADKVMSRIGQTLKMDKAFQGQMAALWKRAGKEGFSRESKQRIAHTYLAKAKRIMPAIRSKIRGDVKAGIDTKGKEKGKKDIPSGGQGGGTKKTISNDPKKIEWGKVTDMDILEAP